jgi:hypothetical protein
MLHRFTSARNLSDRLEISNALLGLSKIVRPKDFDAASPDIAKRFKKIADDAYLINAVGSPAA